MQRSFPNVLFCLVTILGLLVTTVPVLANGSHGTHQDHTSDGPYAISLTTHPSAENIVPDDGTVETILKVTKDGEPAEDVTLSYRLDAPPKKFWFGTEFPVVEGTPLLQGTVAVTDGTQLFDLVYPIRGNYTLRATVTGPAGTSKETFTIPVSGKFQEKINLAVFLLILFLIGAIGGYFLTTGRSARRTAAVLVLVGLGAFLLQPSGVLAHGKGSYNPEVLEERIGTSGNTEDFRLSIRTFPQPVKVGEMLDVTLELERTSGEAHDHHAHGNRTDGDYRAEVNFVHSEGGKKFVGQPVSLRKGRANVQVQLFDGAPHYMLTEVYRSTETYRDNGGDHGHDHGDEHAKKNEHADGDEEAHAGHDHGSAGEESAESGHGHGHGASKPWEWQGQLELSPGDYTVEFAPGPDSAMKWVLLPAGTESLEQKAAEAMKDSCKSASPGTAISADNSCYNLMLNETGTEHELRVEEAGTYRLFTQHVPDEFDMALYDSAGETVGFEREFYPGKGELILTDVRKVDVQPVSPPIDDIVKIMLTLIGVIGLGFLAAWRFKVAMA